MRRWLIELPARATEIGFAWYRLYLIAILFVAGPLLMLTVVILLALWFLLGIRWGW